MMHTVLFKLALVVVCLTFPALGSIVKDIDYRNIEEVLSQQPILLEFYAPWCGHCKNFEIPFQSTGAQLDNHGFVSGKVDIDASPALAARFGVDSIPQFFLIRDNKVWKIKSRRTVDSLVSFCTSDYLSEPDMGMWSSPLGPIGRVKGSVTHMGGKFMDHMAAWSKQMNVPILVPYIMIAILVAIAILLCTFAGIYYSVTHVKTD